MYLIQTSSLADGRLFIKCLNGYCTNWREAIHQIISSRGHLLRFFLPVWTFFCVSKLFQFMSSAGKIQWNPSKTDTIGTNNFVRCSKVSLARGLVVDHAPPTIAASYDKARLWMMK